VTGDEMGKIHHWYEFMGISVCTMKHWHSTPVKTLEFTVDSSFLISGGEEGVLVLWHLQT